MAKCMHKQVIKRIKEVITSSNYLTLSCDEVTMVDNQSWKPIHSNNVQDWCRIPIFIYLEHVIERGGAYNLTKVFMGAFKEHGGFFYVDFVAKLISFGVDGVNVFQGVHNGVICQMQDNYSPHLEGIHCMAHRTNMVVQILFQIPIVKSIKDLLQSLYSFFFHSLKMYIEFFKLEELMKEKRKEILWNVETC
jgi:hypothetical protein